MLSSVAASFHRACLCLQVLSVLVVAEHSLGIWGLLLAVPLTVFALDYCIRCAEVGCAPLNEPSDALLSQDPQLLSERLHSSRSMEGSSLPMPTGHMHAFTFGCPALPFPPSGTLTAP
jgi:hypothetical protein